MDGACGCSSQASGGVSMGSWPMKCALGWDFYDRLWAGMGLPFGLSIILLLYTLVRGRWRKEVAILDYYFLQGCVVMVVYLMFPSSTRSLLEGKCVVLVQFVLA